MYTHRQHHQWLLCTSLLNVINWKRATSLTSLDVDIKAFLCLNRSRLTCEKINFRFKIEISFPFIFLRCLHTFMQCIFLLAPLSEMFSLNFIFLCTHFLLPSKDDKICHRLCVTHTNWIYYWMLRLLYGMFQELFEQIINISALRHRRWKKEVIFVFFLSVSQCHARDLCSMREGESPRGALGILKLHSIEIFQQSTDFFSRLETHENMLLSTSSNRINKFLLLSVWLEFCGLEWNSRIYKKIPAIAPN
jgi:hypothetical protein